MRAIGVPRCEYAAALSTAPLSSLARRVASWISERSEWTVGVLPRWLPSRWIAYALGADLRETRRALAELRAADYLAVIERGPLKIPRYALVLPGRPLRWTEDVPAADSRALSADPAPAIPAEQPKTWIGRVYAGAVAAIQRSAGALVDGHVLDEMPLLPRDMRLELLSGTPQSRERIALQERDARATPTPPAELEDYFAGARHVGPTYATREEAAAARAAALYQRAQAPPRVGDAAPHRKVLLALSEAYRERGVKWHPRKKDHRVIRRVIAKYGVDAALWMCRQIAAGEPGLDAWG